MAILNSFQRYILDRLNGLYGLYVNIESYKSAWLTNNLTDTSDMVDAWIMHLVEIGFISEKVNSSDPVLYRTLNMDYSPISTYTIAQPGRNYLALLTTPVKEQPVIPDKRLQEDGSEKLILPHLGYLKGKWQEKKIMKDADFERLIEYTCYLVRNNTLPSAIVKIPPTNISDAFIRRTYYELYKQFKPGISRGIWIKFLHGVFKQFKCNPNTTAAKFSQYSDASNYDSDKKLIV